jgi:hypothetical protein
MDAISASGCLRQGEENIRPEGEEVMGVLTELLIEQLHNSHFSPNITTVMLRRTKWERDATHVGDIKNVYKILVQEPEGKRPQGVNGNII